MGSRVQISSGPSQSPKMVKRKRRPKKLAELPIHNHILMCKHTKLSEKEKGELFKKYNLTGKELPLILENDAAIAKLDAKPGDVIKIERKSPTAGTALFYRIVVTK